MALEPIALNLREEGASLNRSERTWIASVQDRIRDFRRQHPEVTTLSHSDPLAFARGLRALVGEGWIGGKNFCDWGSGFGLIAGLAALQGFRAHGIEWEPTFVAEAKALAARHALQIRFAQGSFIPLGIQDRFRVIGTYGATDWCPSEPDVYGQLGTPYTEMDLIYAYPWPRELDYYGQLFDTIARPGAVLWLYRQNQPDLWYRKA